MAFEQVRTTKGVRKPTRDEKEVLGDQMYAALICMLRKQGPFHLPTLDELMEQSNGMVVSMKPQPDGTCIVSAMTLPEAELDILDPQHAQVH